MTTPRRISFQTATEMRHLRYTEHLTCAQIAQRFGVESMRYQLGMLADLPLGQAAIPTVTTLTL